MAEIIRMPLLSDTMTEGVIAEWHKNIGDTVSAGDLLAEIETDKATMEFESYHDGVLVYQAPAQEQIPVNHILAILAEEDEDVDVDAILAKETDDTPADASEPASKANENQQQKEAAQLPDITMATETAEHMPKEEESEESSLLNVDGANERLKISPLAKRLAKEHSIALNDLKGRGTGDEGRIVKKDIEAYLEEGGAKQSKSPAVTVSKQTAAITSKPTPPPPAALPPPTVAADKAYQEVRVSQMRKTIARRLAQSKYEAPHFYLRVQVNMGKAIATRKRINELASTKVSFNDLVIKAAAMALRQHPAVNSFWMGDSIRYNNNIHIGMAVALEDGLLVPVIRFTDNKSLSQIATESKALAVKAQNRKLQPDEMTGGTFSISNLGMFGIDEFTAIINPPEACILAVGTIKQTPIVVEGEFVIASMMSLTLSCDHRVVDGATGAKFLKTLKEMLEDPIRMLV